MRGSSGWLCLVLGAALAVPSRTAGAQRQLRFDFPELHIGIAEKDGGPTGATVFFFPGKVKAAVDVRGGAPGTINTDALRLGYETRMMDAVVFAGGSWYGLAAATGVADEIKAKRGDAGEWGSIAGVVGAIIFDLGGRRLSTETPDYELGRSALRSASSGGFPLGARGAGRFAMQGTYFAATSDYADWPHSGQGGAFRQLGSTKIAVFTVVNSLGSIVDRNGRIVSCGATKHPIRDCGTIADRLRQSSDRVRERATASTPAAPSLDDSAPTQNTTITLVVTNQRLPSWALQRLAVQVHTSMARAIQPFGTQRDGDVLYAVTTDQVENANLSPEALGLVASEVAWDAVLSSVPDREPAGDVQRVTADAASLEEFVGEHEFARGARLLVRRRDTRLFAEAVGRGGVYFPAGREVELSPVGQAEFIVVTARRDRVRFERRDGRVTGLTLNPGQWAQRASRVR
ncbi:MAG TPA: P1 family peptidase [Gemmatimonadaceae bacterium]|nr:P1 family peptidase [Gemmatimonadaceae bacterium]